MYLLSSVPHVAMSGPGICQQPRNPLVPNRALRALLVALDEWVSEDKMPPRSCLPRRADGTLVRSRSQKRVGFPYIPGVTFNGLMTTGDLFDYGPSFGCRPGELQIQMVARPRFEPSPKNQRL